MARDPVADKRQQDMARVITLIGIIDQLFTTRASAILKKTGLPYARFSLLHHFGFNPERGWTIGELAMAMEMNQPGITKLVQKLETQGYLIARADPQDLRIKRLFITKSGLSARATALRALAPDVVAAFEGWPSKKIADLRAPLETLKTWLDDHRRP